MKRKGYFAAFEGIDGCGKSSVLGLAASGLRASGFPCLVTHEPRRESEIGKRIYQILHGELPMVAPMELQKLYIIDRLQHVNEEIRPALAGGTVVLADRYWFSTLAYGMLSEPVEKLADLHIEILGGSFLKPDVTFLFDLPPETAVQRLLEIGEGKDHFEKPEKLSRVRENYLALAEADLCETRIIDAAGPLELVARETRSELERRIREKADDDDGGDRGRGEGAHG